MLIYYIIFKSQNLGFKICFITYSENFKLKKKKRGREHAGRNLEDNCSLIAGRLSEGLLAMVIWKRKISGSSDIKF